MFQITLPRKWFIAIIGVADWREKAVDLPYKEFVELQEIIDAFLSRTYKEFRKRGALVGSLLWSHENLAPLFLLEISRENEQFLKEQRAIYDNLPEQILKTLSSDEEKGSLGKNLMKVSPEGKSLLLRGTIPFNVELFPNDHQVLSAFCDAFNAEVIAIKRSEHDFAGRRQWLAGLDNLLHRKFIRDVGPVRKLRAAKDIEGRKQYEKKSPGDFEKIVKILSEMVPFRPSLFELEKPQTGMVAGEKPLGHLLIHYLATGGDFPVKLSERSTTFNRPGRKFEIFQWILANQLEWKELDKLLTHLNELVYDKIERKIADTGGIKFDNFWTDNDLSNNAFFLTNFAFSEDVLKDLKQFINHPEEHFELQIGPGTTALTELWRKAGLHFNLLIFEISGFDLDEEKKLVQWVNALKSRELPGPSYCGDKFLLEQRQYRPF
ncbi:MAG: hypothetical protein K9W42_12080 [Candidatus Heimdallarchaeota archaeon]|nr:hypothetical protein [Candidatus Heimdallarchaeota archaeon]